MQVRKKLQHEGTKENGKDTKNQQNIFSLFFFVILLFRFVPSW
jgi:hypothetical protein